MKVAVVGYRRYFDYATFARHLDEILSHEPQPPSLIISGCCRGVDTLAETYARKHKIPLLLFPPDGDKEDPETYRARNRQIATSL